MNITVEMDYCKLQNRNFEEIIGVVYQSVLGIGREIVETFLKLADETVMAERDTSRYRNKGSGQSCIKTILGPINYTRRVYRDNASAESARYVYLLDQVLEINRIGLVSEDICRLAANSICEMSYRAAADQIREMTGLSISAQGIWDIVQKMGIHQEQLVERHAELAEAGQGAGKIETGILYEEMDGDWLPLQGKSRKEHGPSAEMKLAIAYDGVIYTDRSRIGRRRKLDNKVAYASIDTAENFKRNAEGIICSRYNISEVEMRVRNGDGGNWIMKAPEDTIVVLDSFHRNKAITEYCHDDEFAKLLKEQLYAGNYEMLLKCIDAQINSIEDEKDKADLTRLYTYYHNNYERLSGYYDRGLTVPETRSPGKLHHARLGSMESNVFTLIGNRMKGRRACWSIEGANHLALLLCAKHTVGFESLFAAVASMPTITAPESEPDEDPCFNGRQILGAGMVPEREGNGYEYPHRSDILSNGIWMKANRHHIYSKL